MTIWLVNNVDAILITTVCLAFVGYVGYTFLTAPSAKRKEMISTWLLQAVVEAEKMFNSKTGEIKFSYVYDSYLKQFPLISRFLPKAVFSELVNEALVKMKELIKDREDVRNYVEGDK